MNLSRSIKIENLGKREPKNNHIMSIPTISSSDLKLSLVNNDSVRVNFIKGNGEERIITLTEGSKKDIRYPINGEEYKGDLRFKEGDMLIEKQYQNFYPYPDQYPQTENDNKSSSTFVVYSGQADGTQGIDIINLDPAKLYQLIIYESTNYSYLKSNVLSFKTSFPTNREVITIETFNNKTRQIIENAFVEIVDKRKMVRSFGKTDQEGYFNSLPLPEGRYEIRVSKEGFESKILPGKFIQRREPRRDNKYRIYTNAGNTELGTTIQRQRVKNQNEYYVYLNPSQTTTSSFNQYTPDENPSRLTKL